MKTHKVRYGSWIALGLYLFSFSACTPKAAQDLLAPVNAMGIVLAEQTAKLCGAKKSVVIITPDASWGPVSTAETAFRGALGKQGLTVLATQAASLGDPMKSGVVGLKAADFLDALAKHSDAGAIVSFAGPPLVPPGNGNALPATHPPILVVGTASLGSVPGVPPDQNFIADLVAEKVVQLAIVDGAGNDSGDAGKPDAAHEMFNQNYHILQSAKSAAP